MSDLSFVLLTTPGDKSDRDVKPLIKDSGYKFLDTGAGWPAMEGNEQRRGYFLAGSPMHLDSLLAQLRDTQYLVEVVTEEHVKKFEYSDMLEKVAKIPWEKQLDALIRNG